MATTRSSTKKTTQTATKATAKTTRGKKSAQASKVAVKSSSQTISDAEYISEAASEKDQDNVDQEEMDSLKHTIDDLQKKLDEAETIKSEKQQEIEYLKNSLQNLIPIEKYEKINNEMKLLSEKFHVLEKENGSLNKNVELMKTNEASYNRERSDFDLKVAEYISTINCLKEDVAKLQNLSETYKEKANEHLQQLSESSNKFKLQQENFEKIINEKEDQANKMVNQISNLTKTNNHLQEELNNALQKLDGALESKIQYEELVSKYQKEKEGLFTESFEKITKIINDLQERSNRPDVQSPLLDFYEKLDETSKVSLKKISDQERNLKATINELEEAKREKESIQSQVHSQQSTIQQKTIENNELQNEIDRMKKDVSRNNLQNIDENAIKQQYTDKIQQLESETRDLKSKLSICSKNLLFEQHKNQTMSHSQGLSHGYGSWHGN